MANGLKLKYTGNIEENVEMNQKTLIHSNHMSLFLKIRHEKQDKSSLY